MTFIMRGVYNQRGKLWGNCAILLVVAVLTVLLPHFDCLEARQKPLENSRTSSNTKVMHPAFEKAGKEAGIEIWRIENFVPVPYPKDQYGKFHVGDSYIVLVTKVSKSNHLTWDIHYWLGSETSQDESGAAAILSVQLDDQLGGGPVQYREVQNHESQLFLSIFKNGVRYIPGGINSGFKHVDRNVFEKRLFQVKGSRNIRVVQITRHVKNMNKGDCFILDIGTDIFVYVGIKSKRTEKIKAIGAANQIRDQDHAGKSRVSIVDEYSPQSDFDQFFKALGSGSQREVPDESAGGDDESFERQQTGVVTLYKVSDSSGKLDVTELKQKPLESSMLDTNDCFILDTAQANIFVWVGKHCTQQEKQPAMVKAESFLKTKNYPNWTRIQRVVEGAEPAPFTQYFKTWKGVGEKTSRLVRSASSDKWNPRLFHAEIRRPGEPFRIEEVHSFKQEDLNEEDVMLLDNGVELFVWVGNGASNEEKSRSGDLAKDHLMKLGGDHSELPITHVRQGQEPSSFKGLFEKWSDNMWNNVKSYRNLH